MGGGKDRVVSAELSVVTFTGGNGTRPVPSTSIYLTALSLIVSIFFLLSHVHMYSP